MDPVLGNATATGEDAVRLTYDEAYRTSLVKDQGLAGNITEVHKTVAGFAATDPSYKGKYTVAGMTSSSPDYVQHNGGVTFMNNKVTFTGKGDNTAATKYITKETVDFRQTLLDDGTLVFQADSASLETFGNQ
jgi:hypothetical protein